MFLNFVSFIENEKSKIKFYDYINKRQFKIIFENPLDATKLAIIRVMHFVVLDPTHKLLL